MNSIPLPQEQKGRVKYKMRPEELKDFMNRHGLSAAEFSEILGTTKKAVQWWLSGDREISVTNTRLIKTFDKYPQLLKEF